MNATSWSKESKIRHRNSLQNPEDFCFDAFDNSSTLEIPSRIGEVVKRVGVAGGMGNFARSLSFGRGIEILVATSLP